MANQEFYSRIIHKHDIEANWIKAVNFIPKQGELIIYDKDDTYDYQRAKIGDGITKVNELSFINIPPDWNQNDETALNYIENRPFYEIIGDEVCNPEQSFTPELNSSGTNSFAYLQQDIYIDNIRMYYPTTVTFDGVEYTNLEVWESMSDTCVYIEFTTQNGDVVNICDNFYISMPASYAGTTHTIKITQENTFIKTIENKYLGLPVYPGNDERSICLNSTTNIATRGGCAEGFNTTASSYAHSEGSNTTASGGYSHAEGVDTTASGFGAHAEGYDTTASNYYSHAEGYQTTASGYASHAEGQGTTANTQSQHVQGEYNILDTSGSGNKRGTYAHIVGNGTSDTARSNAHTLDWDGNAWFAGDVYVGGTGQSDGKKLITEDEVPTMIENTFSDLGTITIDIEGATEGVVAGIDADTFQGYTIDSFVMYNVGSGDGEMVEPTIDADTLGGRLPEEYVLKEEIGDVLNGITADNVIMASGLTLQETIGSINRIDFTDEEGNPTDEPYIHWYVDSETGEIINTMPSAEDGEF